MNIHRLDLNLLPVFAALYRERNVSRAALEVGLTQSAMSNALLRLRKSCDDPLFVRTRAGMMPTVLADRMAGPVLDALKLLQIGLDQPGGFDPAQSERTFRLLMSDMGESAILPKLIDALHAAAPGIKIAALRMAHDEYPSALENGTVDLAVGNLSFLSAGYYQQRLFEDNYVCIARADHPIIQDGITLEQYLDAVHVFVSIGNTELLVENALSKGRRRRSIRLEVANYHTAATVVATSDLIASVPRSAAGLGNLNVFPLPFDVPTAGVRQFWHERFHHDPANQWLRSTIAGLELEQA
ncbi:MAG: LysR family transcriptional regulator [Pseudomonadota bacterium]